MKESRRNKKIKYFDSKVTDGKTSARLVSFDHHMRDAFVESKEKGMSLRLASCGVKLGNNQEMEILPGNHSKLSHSPRKFDVGTEDSEVTAKTVKLADLPALAVRQKVTVVCKVVTVSPPEDIVTKADKNSHSKTARSAILRAAAN